MRPLWRGLLAFAGIVAAAVGPVRATVLFEDDFNRGFPGWTAVQPAGAYQDGPLRWQYDIVSGGFLEQSNIYTDDSTYSTTAIAPMLINDTVAGGSFTYSARLTAGDDDGFGLVFGYQNETNFYRVVFARQARTGGFPWSAWSVDRKVDGVTTKLFGYGTPGYVQTFVNTANRPFDVTVAVNGAGQLTLTVVDNPTGTPVNYPLVTSQALPSSAAGKVGIFTWGMSGSVPRGFRIQNLNLVPTALTGNPNPLTNWTAVVPPRTNGSTAVSGGHGQPLWSLAVGKDGPYGTLHEDSDCQGGNDVAGQVDFTGPTLVAGNDTWTDYFVAVRILPHDDDGHGLLLRYKNSTNFYRIALRSQSGTGIGVPPGLSVQKNVNRVYEEVYRDNPVQYNPVAGVPYDLVAQIAGNTLDVTLIADPDGAAQVYTYGPFNITGVNSGKVGVFSWAMSRTEYDWVSVQDGAALYVSSAFGSPSPGKGLSSFSPGTLVDAWAGLPDISQPGIRRTASGWTGAGSVPASGSATNVSFTLNAFSRLHWLWQTEYQLSVTNNPGGTVSFPPGEWFLADSNITVVATPNVGFAFAGWSGDSQSTAATLNLTMNQPYSIVASFSADSDSDGLPDDWELAYFKDLDEEPEGDFPDQDGRSNLYEYEHGTSPLVPDIFEIEDIQIANNNSILTISNNTGTRYSVERSATPSGGYGTIASLQFGSTYTSSVPAGNQAFWRLAQPARPPEVPPFVPGSWTLAVLPDTQHYSESYPELFKDQTRWIVANKDRYNIKYVLHLGDIVNLAADLNQWTNAKTAISLLDGQVPYALATGNHDHGGQGANRTTLVNNYFPVSDYLSWPSFRGTYEVNRIENSYHEFSAGGVNWLVFALEWGPRNGSAAWASQIATNYPHHRKILITHAYMYSDETRYDWATKGSSQTWNPHSYGTASDPDGTNDGEELWNKLVNVNTNFVLTLNGHVLNDGLGRMSSTNLHGNVVHQMLVNYQMKALGGEAVLRLLEFHPDGRTVQVKAYSPYYGTYKTDPQNQFQLTLDPPLF